MHAEHNSENQISFLEEYLSDISPKLKEIDLMIKQTEDTLTIEDTAKALQISSDEVKTIVQQEKINGIDRKTFFKIMENGSSTICKIFKRELDCGSPYIYTKENISYIYNIDLDQVNKACDELKLKEVTGYMIPMLFSALPSQTLNNCNETPTY